MFAATHFVTDPKTAPTQEEMGKRHDRTRDQVRYALQMVEQRFVQYLHGEVREQVDSEQDVGDEVRDLLALLGSVTNTRSPYVGFAFAISSDRCFTFGALWIARVDALNRFQGGVDTLYERWVWPGRMYGLP